MWYNVKDTLPDSSRRVLAIIKRKGSSKDHFMTIAIFEKGFDFNENPDDCDWTIYNRVRYPFKVAYWTDIEDFPEGIHCDEADYDFMM